MRSIKPVVIPFLIITTAVVLFRGWFYRHLVVYKSIGIRAAYPATNSQLIGFIDGEVDKIGKSSVEEVIQLGLSMTSKHLNFTADKNDVDPNKLIISKTAHCIGYASFFSTTCNYLLKQHGLADKWAAKPQIGQLYFLGSNVHEYLDSPFFKDHDFVKIENNATGEVFAVDPTVNDYLHIDFIEISNEKNEQVIPAAPKAAGKSNVSRGRLLREPQGGFDLKSIR